MALALFSQSNSNATETGDRMEWDGYTTPPRLSEGLQWPASQTSVYLSPHLVVGGLLRVWILYL